MSSLIPTINCKSLHELMKSRETFFTLVHSGSLKPGMDFPEEPSRYRIFDVRAPNDFAMSTIADNEDDINMCVNINPEFITPEMTGFHLEQLVCRSSQDRLQQELIRQRSTQYVDLIIFMDWRSTEADVSDKHLLVSLMTILTKKDPGKMPPRHVMLDGGFREWIHHFPELTTNSDVMIPEEGGIEELQQSVEVPEYLLDPPRRVPQVPVDLISSPSIHRRPKRHENVGKVLELLEEIERLYEEQKRVDSELVRGLGVMVTMAKEGATVDPSHGDDFRECEKQSINIKKKIEKREENMAGIDQNVPWFSADSKKRLHLKKSIELLKKLVATQKRNMEKMMLEFTGLRRPPARHQIPSIRLDSENIHPASFSSEPSFPRRRASSEHDFSKNHEHEAAMDIDEGQMEIDEVSTNIDNLPTNIVEVPPRNFEDQIQAVRGKTTPGTTGLKNERGYLCYANNIIQCLSHLSQIKNFFTSNLEANGGKITEMLSRFMKLLWSGKYKSFFIEPLKDKIAENHKDFDNKRYQDTQEFLGVLLDSLHEELKDLMKLSIISETFDFQTHSVIKCKKCNHSTERSDPFRYWLVTPPEDGIEDLKQSIDAMMEEDIEWECPQCRDPSGHAEKSQIFTKLPPVLIVVISRFKKTKQGEEIITVKNRAPVNYPMELNLMVGKSGEKREMNYQLRGISCHSLEKDIPLGDELKNGHYISVCKHLENGRWYRFDDSTVEEVHNQDGVLGGKESAYVLFYSLGQ